MTQRIQGEPMSREEFRRIVREKIDASRKRMREMAEEAKRQPLPMPEWPEDRTSQG
ncbi:MAG: hypothetical protein AB1758_21430 [Candidatus Eremiobacterota bacterium]